MTIKDEVIRVVKAKEHNLKEISVDIPLNASTCVTGISGGGKSSLVYDTIYAESQREFLESMSGSIYGQKLMDKPRVESIENLRPALNVAQTSYNVNPRSSVGTLTDISYYLRTLFALVASYQEKQTINDNYFSYNNPASYCPFCKGLGIAYDITENLLMPNPKKSLRDGGIIFYKGKETSLEYKLLEAICEKYNIDIDKKVEELTPREKEILLYKETEDEYPLKFRSPKGRYKQKKIRSKGAIVELRSRMKDSSGIDSVSSVLKFAEEMQCPICHGKRLNDEVLEHKINGKDIGNVEGMPLSNLSAWIQGVADAYTNTSISEHVRELANQTILRIQSIAAVKVDYLSLNRSIPSLSGGELQRLRIANQLNCSLKGLIYILDEPCKGLHPRNIDGIILAVKKLVKKGNTVISIEHNLKYISEADKVIELGPEGGENGGYLVSESTGKPYDFHVDYSILRDKKLKDFFQISGINWHNISNQNVVIPIKEVTFITGVSGSGKSSLMEVIEEAFSKRRSFLFSSVTGEKKIKKLYKVNQQPIGKTPRSTVVSYLGIYDEIRELFANTQAAQLLGLSASDFSMNVRGGRCECCQGTGMQKINLNYLPSSYVLCPECNGKRFHDDILTVKYNGLTINDVLDFSVDTLIHYFEEDELISRSLSCMKDLGLGYVKLGQMSMNLSGGEAQRIKLVKALSSTNAIGNLYLLDEPTSGLNIKDVMKLESVLTTLKENGNTIIIIDHNVDFIARMADYMIDFGIHAGVAGGTIVDQGTPLHVFNNKDSSWGDYFLSHVKELTE